MAEFIPTIELSDDEDNRLSAAFTHNLTFDTSDHAATTVSRHAVSDPSSYNEYTMSSPQLVSNSEYTADISALASPAAAASAPEPVLPVSTELNDDEDQHQHQHQHQQYHIAADTHQFTTSLDSLNKGSLGDEPVFKTTINDNVDQLSSQHPAIDHLHNDEQTHNDDNDESTSDILIAELEEASQANVASTTPKAVKLEQQTRHRSHSRSSFGDTEMENDFGEARLYTSPTTTTTTSAAAAAAWSPRATSSPNYSSRAFARYGDDTMEDSVLHADVDESAMAELLGENEDLSSRRKFAMMTRLDDDHDDIGGDFHVAHDVDDVDDDDDDITSYEPHMPMSTKNSLKSGDRKSNDRSLPPLQVPKPGVQPHFEVTVSEPQKIGVDAINARIVYKVRTKTNSRAFRYPDVTVERRYNDFVWLYNRLVVTNPGIIVPPIPEKNAFGRFQNEFVENRRVALENCLRRMTAHPLLYGDPELRRFLESETFSVEVSHRKDTAKGLIRAVGNAVNNITLPKFQETDEWFEERGKQLELFENQLKALLRAVEMMIRQRKELAVAHGELSTSMLSLASVDLGQDFSTELVSMGDLQTKLQNIQDRQALLDTRTLEDTVNEYVRLVSSIRVAFGAREKMFQLWQSSIRETQRRQAALTKAEVNVHVTRERLAQMAAEIAESKSLAERHHSEFKEISLTLRNELVRFDRNKVDDLKHAIQNYYRAMLESQREVRRYD
ncbi:Vps5 C terminal like-domain-containing protein [Syncephalis plumigaleata]|nr:Vps5 C terminal like-domain-containing protein [Syncephalis plumigaleata]